MNRGVFQKTIFRLRNLKHATRQFGHFGHPALGPVVAAVGAGLR